jgi:hypothetical protein
LKEAPTPTARLPRRHRQAPSAPTRNDPLATDHAVVDRHGTRFDETGVKPAAAAERRRRDRLVRERRHVPAGLAVADPLRHRLARPEPLADETAKRSRSQQSHAASLTPEPSGSELGRPRRGSRLKLT